MSLKAKLKWHGKLFVNQKLRVGLVNTVKLEGVSVWVAQRDECDSWGWKNLLTIRDSILNHIMYKIGNGESTYMCQEGEDKIIWVDKDGKPKMFTMKNVYDDPREHNEEERNFRIFRNLKRDWSIVLQLICDAIKSRLMGLKVKKSSAVDTAAAIWNLDCGNLSTPELLSVIMDGYISVVVGKDMQLKASPAVIRKVSCLVECQLDDAYFKTVSLIAFAAIPMISCITISSEGCKVSIICTATVTLEPPPPDDVLLLPAVVVVKWVEHLEIEENREYDDLITNAKAYGAHGWVACLKRACERISYETGEQRPVMNLGKRMVKNFFECVGATYGTNIWSRALILKEMKVHTTLRKSNDGIIFGAAATVDDATESTDTPLRLQEASINQYGSLVVWSSVNATSLLESLKLRKEAINTPVMTPSGFSISPGDHQTAMSSTATAGSSSTSSGGGGSNVTVAVQMMLTSQPSEEIEIHDIIGIAAKAIKETVLKLDGTLY
ncbi:hypothetical protein Tco_0625659 [Tanacetum coccineum]|uniref:HD-Zip IV C-terminal domain-containing protein n=1 Tax=Tanacetum coccineum TaxID=301880 RepID=A0ABQ4WHI1_9ASTR